MEEKAINKVGVPGFPEIPTTNEDDFDLLPEVPGFGWNSEEEEKEFLTEEFGPEWVAENWKPWAERMEEESE